MTDATSSRNAPAIPWLPIAAAVGVAVLGPLLVAGCYLWFGFDRIAALLIGLGIGAAIRFTDRSGDVRLAWLAVGLTILSAGAGMVWVDQAFITWLLNGQPVQPTLGDTFGRLTRDLASSSSPRWAATSPTSSPAGRRDCDATAVPAVDRSPATG